MKRRFAGSGAWSALVVGLALWWPPQPAGAASAIDRLYEEITRDVRSGHNVEGLAAAQKLEGLVRRQQGTNNKNYAGVLHNQGMFLHNLGRYQEAAEKLRAALSIKLSKSDAEGSMRTGNVLVGSLIALDRYDEARSVAQQSLALGTAAYGADDPRLVGTLSALGLLARQLENYKDAEGYFERALAIQQRAPKPDLYDISDAMDDLGDLYGLEGRFDDGERLLLQSVKTREQLGAGQSFSKIFNDLGNLYKDAGRLAESETAFKRALADDRARQDENHPNVAATMGNLASVLEDASRFAEAEIYYKKTLLIYEKVFGPDHPTTAVGLSNLANNYRDQGRSQDALGLQQRVLAIYEKSSGPESTDVARTLTNMANSYEKVGRDDESGALYEKSLRIIAAKFGENSPQATTALANLARWELDHDKLDGAEEKLNRALRIKESAFAPDHPELIDNLRSLGFLYIKRKNYPKARELFERALAIADVKFGARHQKTIFTRINLAGVLSSEEKWPEALALLRRALSDNAGQEGRLAVEHLPDLDNALIEALWRVSNGKPDDRVKDEAFAAAQRAYETQAGTALTQMAARFAAGDDAVAALVRKQQDLTATLENLDQRITAELGAVAGKRNDALIASLRAEADRAKKSFDQVTLQIAREFPGYVELSKPAPLSVAQVQGLLKPDEALVSFLSQKDQSFVYAITREGSSWQRVPKGYGAISEQVAKLRAGLFNADPNAAGPAPFDLGTSYELYASLFGPIESFIGRKPKLLVVPTGSLTSLPFQVLLTKKPDPSVPADDRYGKAAWLLNDKAITVLPAVSSLRALRSFAKASRATKPFIGFGDPVLQRQGTDKRSVSRGVQPYRSYYRGTTVDIDVLRRGLAALPDTADELRAVAKELGATESDVHLGAAATVTSVKAAALAQYRVVDFATHGLVAGEVGGLSEPALVLTLPDQPTSDDDGLLTANRVAKLNLDADWAVLSACNTAAGNSPGAEGLSGLARAFFYAGARALLVSHWPVESEAAVKLTTRAFSELAKNPSIGRAEALRRSMRALIADPSSAGNSNPARWAPFVLVGEGS